MKRFPEDDKLRHLGESLLRDAHHAEREELKKKIERFPNPTLYARLAHIYLEDGEIDHCLQVCQRALRSYPDYGGTYLVLAEIQLREGKHETAMPHLEKAVELDAHNYTALMMLTEEYLLRGRKDEAKALLERILEFAAGDEDARQMLADLDSIAAEKAAEGKALRIGESPPEEDKSATRAEEPPEKPAKRGGSSTAMQSVPEALGKALAELTGVPGVQGYLLIDEYGLIVASSFEEGYDEELSAALVSNTCRAIDTCSADLTIGEFQEGVLEGTDGNIHLADAGELILAIFASAETKAGLLQRVMHTCIEKVSAVG